MIIATYSWVSPLLMPMGALFYSFSYLMYKYQLLYVYINKDQSGGFMWYDISSHHIPVHCGQFLLETLVAPYCCAVCGLYGS
jgi:Calcium-dependent channel, 7TM region, putative phosphate